MGDEIQRIRGRVKRISMDTKPYTHEDLCMFREHVVGFKLSTHATEHDRQYQQEVARWLATLDAALARAEKAEQERDRLKQAEGWEV